MKHTIRWSGAILTAVMALTVAPRPAAADEMVNEAGMGAASALATLVYGPVKLVYATCGLVFGGIAWGLSGGDSQVLTAVVTPAVRGDYVVTPEHLRMQKSLEFFGRDPAYREQDSQQLASDSPPAPTHEDF